MTGDAGRLLLILASTDAQTVAELTTASRLPPAETIRQLERLVAQGFVVAATLAGDLVAYRLNPKGRRTEAGPAQPRILLIEDDLAVSKMMTVILESDGYGLIVVQTAVDAQSLLEEVAFDLVITDGLDQRAGAVLTSTQSILTAAGVTPVALFTAHRMELDAAQAAGFRDLIEKPFDLDVLEQQVRTLLV